MAHGGVVQIFLASVLTCLTCLCWLAYSSGKRTHGPDITGRMDLFLANDGHGDGDLRFVTDSFRSEWSREEFWHCGNFYIP
jgi:hypothetical protein